MTKLFVGFQTTQAELETAFPQFGAVERVEMVTDRYSGQPRGFLFVEMTERGAAEAAITQLNGSVLDGRGMKVNEARPKTEGSGRGGRGNAGHGAAGGRR